MKLDEAKWKHSEHIADLALSHEESPLRAKDFASTSSQLALFGGSAYKIRRSKARNAQRWLSQAQHVRAHHPYSSNPL